MNEKRIDTLLAIPEALALAKVSLSGEYKQPIYFLVKWGGQEVGKRVRSKLAVCLDFKTTADDQLEFHIQLFKFEPWTTQLHNAKYSPRWIRRADILHVWDHEPTKREWFAQKKALPLT